MTIYQSLQRITQHRARYDNWYVTLVERTLASAEADSVLMASLQAEDTPEERQRVEREFPDLDTVLSAL